MQAAAALPVDGAADTGVLLAGGSVAGAVCAGAAFDTTIDACLAVLSWAIALF